MKLIKLGIGFVVACASFMGMVGESYAGKSTSQDVDFSIELTSGCSINASSVPFGTHLISTADLIGVNAGTVVINCTNLQAYSWGVSGGGNYSAGNRRLGYGTNFMTYKLYVGGTEIGDKGIHAIDSAYVDTTTTQVVATGTGNGADQTMNLTADVLISSSPVAGTYLDTATVTVAW